MPDRFLIPLPENPKDKRIVVGYARVSTKKLEQEKSIDMQIADFQRMGVDHIISERRSASKGVRPGWEELRALVARRKVRLVIMNDLSRLARDGSDMEFLEECAVAGTEVRDVHGQVWENQTVGGLLATGVTSLMNKVQSRMIGIKARDGIRRRREAGYLARGRMPFGYMIIDEQAAKHPEHWNEARWLFEQLLCNQMAWNATIRQLPEDFPFKPTQAGLRSWFMNPILRGGIGEGGRNLKWRDVEWGRAPALITHQEFEEALQVMAANRYQRSDSKSPELHLFSSMIRCVHCNKYMGWKSRRSMTHSARYQCRNARCAYGYHTVKESVIKDAVAEALCRRAERMAQVLIDEENKDGPSPEENKLWNQLQQLEALQRQGVPRLERSIKDLRDEIAMLKTAPITDIWMHPDYRRIFSNPENFKLPEVTDDVLRRICLQFISRVEYCAERKAVVRIVMRLQYSGVE